MVIALIACSIGIHKLESNFTVQYFIPEGSITQKYFEIFNLEFDFGRTIWIYHESDEVDWASEEI